jgi:hypothetical protein
MKKRVEEKPISRNEFRNDFGVTIPHCDFNILKEGAHAYGMGSIE